MTNTAREATTSPRGKMALKVCETQSGVRMSHKQLFPLKMRRKCSNDTSQCIITERNKKANQLVGGVHQTQCQWSHLLGPVFKVEEQKCLIMWREQEMKNLNRSFSGINSFRNRSSGWEITTWTRFNIDTILSRLEVAGDVIFGGNVHHATNYATCVVCSPRYLKQFLKKSQTAYSVTTTAVNDVSIKCKRFELDST